MMSKTHKNFHCICSTQTHSQQNKHEIVYKDKTSGTQFYDKTKVGLFEALC